MEGKALSIYLLQPLNLKGIEKQAKREEEHLANVTHIVHSRIRTKLGPANFKASATAHTLSLLLSPIFSLLLLIFSLSSSPLSLSSFTPIYL